MLSHFASWTDAKNYWRCIATYTNKLGTITKKATWCKRDGTLLRGGVFFVVLIFIIER